MTCLRLLSLGAFAAALFLAGCGGEPPSRVLLISIDALRADALGTYGNPAPTSPFLDGLGARGVVFENAIVNTHGTTPSHTTMLSGLSQESHGVGLEGSEGGVVATGIPAGVTLLPERLRAAGVHTVGITDGGNAGAGFGFARGFDVFDDRGGGVEKVARRLERHLCEAMDSAPDRPLFAFLHTYEVHSPYAPPPSAREPISGAIGRRVTSEWLLARMTAAASLPPGELARIRALYDAEVRHTDDTLGQLFARLERCGFLDGSLVIVTADHGEEFGEHGGLLHGGHLYEELLHVPLIAVGPGLAPRREAAVVSTVDLAPSILARFGLPIPPELEGRALFDDPEALRRPLAFAQYGRDRYAARGRRWKLVETPAAGRVELYDLAADPGERHDLSAALAAEREQLRAALDAWRRTRIPRGGAAPPVTLDEAERSRLRALGYAGG